MSFEIHNDNFVTTITLNNPDKHNALDAPFWNQFPKVIKMLENDKTRVLIIKANGKSFSSGLDTSLFSDPSLFNVTSPLDRERFMHLVILLQNTLTTIREARFPVIAAIQGPCIGAGLDLVAACDMRYSTENAFFRLAEINLGLMADLGTLQLLPDSIPSTVLAEMAYTGRDLSAEQAKSCGLVNAVYKDKEVLFESVGDTAKSIASKAPLALYQTKLALRYRQDGHSIEDSLKHAALLQSAFLDTEAIKSSFKKENKHKNLLPIPDNLNEKTN